MATFGFRRSKGPRKTSRASARLWEVVQLCRPLVEKEWRLSIFRLHNCTTCQVHMFPCLKKELAIADFFAPSASLPADCRGLIVGQDSWLAAQRAAARSARPMRVRDATKSGAAAPLYLHSASRARALRQDHARRRCVSRQQHEAHAAHVAAARGRKKRARSARSGREAVQLRADARSCTCSLPEKHQRTTLRPVNPARAEVTAKAAAGCFWRRGFRVFQRAVVFFLAWLLRGESWEVGAGAVL